MEEAKKTGTKAVVAGAGAVLTALATWSVTTFLDQQSAIDARLDQLERDSGKWEILADQETRLRNVEVATQLHDALMQRFLDHHIEELLVDEIKKTIVEPKGRGAPESRPVTPGPRLPPQQQQQQIQIPRYEQQRIDPDILRSRKVSPKKGK